MQYCRPVDHHTTPRHRHHTRRIRIASPPPFHSCRLARHEEKQSQRHSTPLHPMHCRPCPSQLSPPLAPIIPALPFPEPALPMARSGLRLSLPAAVLAVLLLLPPSALASEPLNPEGNAASFRPCMVQQQHLVGFFLIVPSRASFACSAGVDRHQAGAGRPARRAQELGPGLRRPLQLGHDHLLPAEPRHRPVSSRPSPSSSRPA